MYNPAYKMKYSIRNGNGTTVGEDSIEIESIRVKEWDVGVGVVRRRCPMVPTQAVK